MRVSMAPYCAVFGSGFLKNSTELRIHFETINTHQRYWVINIKTWLSGNLPMLQWAHLHWCPWDVETSNDAAINGHWSVVVPWVRQRQKLRPKMQSGKSFSGYLTMNVAVTSPIFSNSIIRRIWHFLHLPRNKNYNFEVTLYFSFDSWKTECILVISIRSMTWRTDLVRHRMVNT